MCSTVHLDLITFVLWLEKERYNDSDAIGSYFCCMFGLEKKKKDPYGSGHNSDVCRCGGFPTPTSNSLTLAGYPTVQLNSHTTWTKSQIPQLEGSVPYSPPPVQMPVASPGYHL